LGKAKPLPLINTDDTDQDGIRKDRVIADIARHRRDRKDGSTADWASQAGAPALHDFILARRAALHF
jgi:hypothetical protein